MFYEKFETALQFLQHLWRRFTADGCRQSAAALTYMSLFAVVPLMTLMYSMFSLIPAFQEVGDQVRDLIFENFVPKSGEEVQDYLVKFSNQARKLSAAGAAMLLVTSYLMLTNIEKTFNAIWGTTGGRKGLSSFLLYWGILSLGPLLLGLALLMRTYLLSFKLMVDEVAALGFIAWLFEYLPLLLTWLAFTLLFVAVPNCRVQVRFAIIGGLVTTFLFELAKTLFSEVIANTSYANVYGAFAIVPVFLIWLYVGWIIVLGGAELVRSLETFNAAKGQNRYPDLVIILMIIWECWRRQTKGRETSDRDILRMEVNDEHWRQLRDKMLAKHFLAVTANGHYVLMRDPANISLWQLAELFEVKATELPTAQQAESLMRFPWYGALAEILHELDTQARKTLSPTVQMLFAKEQETQS